MKKLKLLLLPLCCLLLSSCKVDVGDQSEKEITPVRSEEKVYQVVLEDSVKGDRYVFDLASFKTISETDFVNACYKGNLSNYYKEATFSGYYDNNQPIKFDDIKNIKQDKYLEAERVKEYGFSGSGFTRVIYQKVIQVIWNCETYSITYQFEDANGALYIHPDDYFDTYNINNCKQLPFLKRKYEMNIYGQFLYWIDISTNERIFDTPVDHGRDLTLRAVFDDKRFDITYNVFKKYNPNNPTTYSYFQDGEITLQPLVNLPSNVTFLGWSIPKLDASIVEDTRIYANVESPTKTATFYDENGGVYKTINYSFESLMYIYGEAPLDILGKKTSWIFPEINRIENIDIYPLIEDKIVKVNIFTHDLDTTHYTLSFPAGTEFKEVYNYHFKDHTIVNSLCYDESFQTKISPTEKIYEDVTVFIT